MGGLREARERAASGLPGRRVALLLLSFLLPLAASTMGAGTALSDTAASLNGQWSPFTRCPVEDPAMLAVDGRAQISFCIAASSPGGTFKLGNTTAAAGDTGLQFGITGARNPPWAVVAPAGGVIAGAPVDVPGGLLGLMCPSGDPVVASVCSLITDSNLNRVTATVEAADNPTDFSISAGLQVGTPIVTLPIKVRLQNPLLGSTCYIGSDANPIILRPAVVDASKATFGYSFFDLDGTPNPSGPLIVLSASGLKEADTTFAVPGANGCGLAGVLNGAINFKTGLPSPSGNNSLVLDNASSYAVSFSNATLFYPNAGQAFSDAWHAAVCSDCPTAPPAETPAALPIRLNFSLGLPLGLGPR